MPQPCTWRPVAQPGAAAYLMDPLKDQQQITTTTICPTRSILTVPDGPGRRPPCMTSTFRASWPPLHCS
jgi:hypothetical protein